MLKLILVWGFSAAMACAQGISVGVLGGAPFNDVVNGNTVNGIQSISRSTNFTIGPAIRVNLPVGFRVEADALYRPYSFDATGRTTSLSVSGQQWRFPILLQYRFGGAPIVKPFVEAGLSFGHLSGISDAEKTITSGPGQQLHQSDAGPVLGVGVDLKVPFVRVSGELRYTHQSVSYFSDFSNLNQAEVLFGIHF